MQGKTELSNSISISKSTYLTIVIDVEEDLVSFDKMKEIIDSINGTFDSLKNNHIKAFKKLYNRTTINIVEGENC